MGAERWRRISELYHKAFQQPERERHAFLASGGDDDRPRGEVGSLRTRDPDASSAVSAETGALPDSEGGPASPLGGRVLGRYRIGERLGAGGMGVVYRARDTRLERDVAIKVLPPAALANDAARIRFRKEALALARLNHPNIGTLFDFNTENGVDFLAMELVTGESLDAKIAARSVTSTDVATLGIQIASALEEAHEHRIVHCDLKREHSQFVQKRTGQNAWDSVA